MACASFLQYKYIYPISSIHYCTSPHAPLSPPINSSLPQHLQLYPPHHITMSVPSADYDFLEPHFDLTTEFKPGPPPYLPPGYKFLPVRVSPTYPLNSSSLIIAPSSQQMSQGHRLGDLGNELSPSGHPEDASKHLAISAYSHLGTLTSSMCTQYYRGLTSPRAYGVKIQI
jgi:hypothetical protein